SAPNLSIPSGVPMASLLCHHSTEDPQRLRASSDEALTLTRPEHPPAPFCQKGSILPGGEGMVERLPEREGTSSGAYRRSDGVFSSAGASPCFPVASDQRAEAKKSRLAGRSARRRVR